MKVSTTPPAILSFQMRSRCLPKWTMLFAYNLYALIVILTIDNKGVIVSVPVNSPSPLDKSLCG